jgi:hypothetical protein
MNALTILHKIDRKAFIELRRAYQKRVRTFPAKLEPVDESEIEQAQQDNGHMTRPLKSWRSRDFLAQLFQDGDCLRLSVNRTDIDNSGNWKDGITWDELMACKRACGFGNQWAVEVFPPDSQVVNVAPIRHLFLIDQPPYAWTKP